MNNPFNAAPEMVNPSHQQKNDNFMSGFTMNGLNTATLLAQPASGVNSLTNFAINSMPSNFGGFSFGAAPPTKAADNFTPSSVFAQSFNNQLGTKSVEKPAPQVLIIIF